MRWMGGVTKLSRTKNFQQQSRGCCLTDGLEASRLRNEDGGRWKGRWVNYHSLGSIARLNSTFPEYDFWF